MIKLAGSANSDGCVLAVVGMIDGFESDFNVDNDDDDVIVVRIHSRVFTSISSGFPIGKQKSLKHFAYTCIDVRSFRLFRVVWNSAESVVFCINEHLNTSERLSAVRYSAQF